MFKFVIVIFDIIAYAAAKPGLIGAPLAYTAHAAIVAAPAPFITATSSQVIVRNYNGIVTTPVVAPVVDISILAKTIAAPISAAHTAPIPAYRTYIVAKRFASTPLAYSSHLVYTPAPVLW